ncbi:unnamed protein product, partial [Mycena citricolor]
SLAPPLHTPPLCLLTPQSAMNPGSGGAYMGALPFASQNTINQHPHQGINPAMLAGFNQQPQPQQTSFGGAVSPAQLLNGMGGMQQPPSNQQHMPMSNGAAMNPAALSAPPNATMPSGGANAFPHTASGAPLHSLAQQQQMQAQLVQIMMNSGITREQIAAMNPPERTAALRNAMVVFRQHAQAASQAQAAQQHHTTEQSAFNRPGHGSAATGMGNGSVGGMNMGALEAEGAQTSPQPNNFQPAKSAVVPHFGTTVQNTHQPSPSFPSRLPSGDPSPSVLRSNSSGSTPESNSLLSASGQPQTFAKVQRISSPVKATPALPVSGSVTSASTPAQVTSSNVPLPSLPASVNLNPNITRVTVVPLSTSRETIPALEATEIKDVKSWMEIDTRYEAVVRDMTEKMSAESRDALNGPNIPWWDRGSLATNNSKFLVGREKFDVRYPHRKRDREESRRKPKREGLKIPGKPSSEQAAREEELVPIRVEFDVEHQKIRDTFVWDLNASIALADFAQTVIEDYSLPAAYHGVIVKSIEDQLSDYRAHSVAVDRFLPDSRPGAGLLEGDSAEWWAGWRKRLRPESHAKARKRPRLVKKESEDDRAMSLDEFLVDSNAEHQDLRILIRLDVTVGSMKLDDQFEWDLDNPDASPEEFARIYTQDLGLSGEFRTAIAHLIREQVVAHQKSLFLVGHPMDGTAVQDEELRYAFLPSLASGARSMDQVQAFTPLLNYLSDGELERNDKEREKDMNKRKKRNRGGRRGVPLPDREPIRTCRTPAIGFPEPDPAVVAAAVAVHAPVSRRAAAAAASLTIANLVASENGESRTSFTPSLPSLPAPPPLVVKPKSVKGFFKPPQLDKSILRARARVPAPIPSTGADVTKLPVPLENDPPPAPIVTASYPRAPRPVTAKRAKELEREAKEREFAEGQHENMIDGIWHCSNCGCPDSIAIGRRKGPLGDKSQCGACGKYWHRFRRPRPFDYNPSYDYHANLLKKEADQAKRKRRPAASSVAPEIVSRQSPVRDVSPASTASTSSEAPLAQRIKIKRSQPAAASPTTLSTPPEIPAPSPAPPPPTVNISPRPQIDLSQLPPRPTKACDYFLSNSLDLHENAASSVARPGDASYPGEMGERQV